MLDAKTVIEGAKDSQIGPYLNEDCYEERIVLVDDVITHQTRWPGKDPDGNIDGEVGEWEEYAIAPYEPYDALVAETERQVRAEYVEIECPAYCCIEGANCTPGQEDENGYYPQCEHCGGTGKLYKRGA